MSMRPTSNHFGILCGALWLSTSTLGCNALLANDFHDDTNSDATAPDDASPAPDQGASDSSRDATARSDAGVDSSSDGTAPTADVVTDAMTDGSRTGDANESASDGSTGTTTPCTAGGACLPSECQNGTWACTDGGRVCQPTTTMTPGTPCGTAGGDAGSQVCSSAGKCLACNAGGDCSDPATPCVKKTYDCTSGAAVCQATSNVADGTSCGGGLFCNAGACAACQVGAPCSPTANACHVGKITACTGSVATCTDQGSAAAAGKSCTAAGGASGVCDGNGACAACARGSQCNPNGNVCQIGVESCSAGPQCQSPVAVREGQTCGAAQVCHNGTCSACDGTSCASGCCDSHGCVTTAQTVTECGTGTGGAACTSCAGPTSGTGGAVCTGNACAIACTGATPNACNRACVNVKTDDANCGGCGHACAAGYHCNGGGMCTCTPAANACGSDNCGIAQDGCGKMVNCGTCTLPLTCSAAAGQPGTCVCPAVSACTLGQTACVSGGIATCQVGSNGCLAFGAPVACSPLDACHVAGACMATTVACSNPVKIVHGMQAFSVTGDFQTWPVPDCVTSINVDAAAGSGGAGPVDEISGSAPGGPGGRVQATLALAPATPLRINVGRRGADQSQTASCANLGSLGGYIGGGPVLCLTAPAGGGGGGATDIRVSAYQDSARILVVGGGGGGGNAPGGAGGGLIGGGGCVDFFNNCNGGQGGGFGGGQLAGGSGSAAQPGMTVSPAADGQLASGGEGGTCSNAGIPIPSGGGGGGGLYGGGGGCTYGGGGGSSFVGPMGSNVVNTQGVNTGDGYVKITW